MAAPFAKKLYESKAWKQCRDSYFAAHHGICERCGAPGVEVHHRKKLTPANINDPEIVFGWENLELLCRDCHIAEHEKAKNLRHGKPVNESELRVMFDENGQPKPRGRVIVVWGAPYSGKSEYIRERMHHMDMIVSLDRLTECFTGLVNGKDEPDKITDYLPAMLKVREAVYKAIRERLPGVCTVWIEAGLPRKRDRQTLAGTIPQATFVKLEADVDDCLQKAKDEKQRKIVLEWFRNYQAD